MRRQRSFNLEFKRQVVEELTLENEFLRKGLQNSLAQMVRSDFPSALATTL